MASLEINQDKITPEIARELVKLCPFSAITYNGALEIASGCKMCGLCVKNGPAGAVALKEEKTFSVNKDEWRGAAVYAEILDGKIHNVSLELIGKARELAAVTGHPVYALLAGHNVAALAQELLHYGVDKIFVYDDPALKDFRVLPYAKVFEDFINKAKPSSVLTGATVTGRSLAPRAAARFRAGLTADCTVLEMKKNTDLVQIRPAFGGNIMAQIITPDRRPQFCTARHKIFPAAKRAETPSGVIENMSLSPAALQTPEEILKIEDRPRHVDISEAKTIVAVGRGLKAADIELARGLAEILGAEIACTRPLIESGAFDPRRQIGLSGRTVAADLIITLGISGAVQFTAGMRGCKCIIAVNNDPRAPIFDAAHYAVTGDAREILPKLIARCGGLK